MDNYAYQLAVESDDIALRELLLNNPMKGSIEVVCAREPNYFHGAQVEGKFHQTMICKDAQNGCIVGMATRSIKPVYINGKICDVGYLSNLRISEEHRGKKLLSNGWKFLAELHKDMKTSIYLASIIEDNYPALSAILKNKNSSFNVLDLGKFHTTLINILGKRKFIHSNDIQVEKGSLDNLGEIIDCFKKNGSQKQFFPAYIEDDFLPNNNYLRDFSINDLYVAKRKKKILAVAGTWNQINYKQMIVNQYNGKMKFIRPIYNTVAKIFRSAQLPEPSKPINIINVSFIAIDNNNPEIFRILLQNIHNDSADKKFSYLAIGLHSQDPLLKVTEEYPRINYKSKIFAATIDGQQDFLKKIDNRIPYLELAAL